MEEVIPDEKKVSKTQKRETINSQQVPVMKKKQRYTEDQQSKGKGIESSDAPRAENVPLVQRVGDEKMKVECSSAVDGAHPAQPEINMEGHHMSTGAVGGWYRTAGG
jgi:hypothetical protein